MPQCLEWHARWAVSSCFPQDEHLEAHVRWARHYCVPSGDDVFLSRRRQDSSIGCTSPAIVADAPLQLDEQVSCWDESIPRLPPACIG